ncbi:unnamed protein product [Ambrosiozyma monospora]|uniref:Unnamed protein product n=1 Tax=Ambrosiozyma monospora TaxID=43982 RepID=A0ACB5TR00_AMBMO|nr:unnamed protein product [Ambrosiozyma monospora]
MRSSLNKVKPVPRPEEKIPEALQKFGKLNKPKVAPKPATPLPEALQKFGKLNKPKPAPKPDIQLPEALQKIGKLSKTKVAPKPKENVPEALQRFQRLKTGSGKEKKPATIHNNEVDTDNQGAETEPSSPEEQEDKRFEGVRKVKPGCHDWSWSP